MSALQPATTLADTWRAWEPRREREHLFDWGLPWLREALPAPMPGSLTVVGGRDGSGKSMLAASLLDAAARATGRPAVYASFEDPALEVGRRAAAGGWSPGLLVACPESALLSVAEATIAEAGRLGACFAAVDYLHVLQYDGPVKLWSREGEVSALLAALKACAKRAAVPLVVLSQCRKPSNEGAADPGARGIPSRWELRDSGMIAAMAEVVLMLGTVVGGTKVRIDKAKAAATGRTQRYEFGRGGRLVEAAAEGAAV